MKRPPWEVADVIRRAGRRFIDRYQECLTWPQVKVLKAIERCRTAALGGHRDQCDRCGHQAISYNSCRNRHCPKCQTNARDKWLAARQQELLPADYYHLVFSVPHALVPLMWQNKKLLFKLLFETSAETLLEVAADPQTPRRPDRLLERSAYVGPDPAAASPRSLCGDRRRTVAGSSTMDPLAEPLLPAGESPEPGLSWKVRGGIATRLSPQQARLLRSLPITGS